MPGEFPVIPMMVGYLSQRKLSFSSLHCKRLYDTFYYMYMMICLFTLHSSTGKLYNVSFSTDEVNEIVSFVRVIPSIEFVLKERKVREREGGREGGRKRGGRYLRERGGKGEK